MINIETLIGSKSTIHGHVGGILIESKPGEIGTKNIGIGRQSPPATVLVIEEAHVANNIIANSTGDSNINTRYIAFRIDGTSRYLTINPYGNAAKAYTLEVLSSCNLPMLLPDLYQKIVDYQVEDATTDGDWEGQGYNYASMTAQESNSPTIFQSFCIEGNELHSVGIKSYFGNYWRSQHWTHTISQAPHMERDETWQLSVFPFSPQLVGGRYRV